MGDSGEQDLELYTEMALGHRGQILGIFIRDVTTPLLTRTSSSSSLLPSFFFEGNDQPAQRQGRLAHLKGFRESWRTKSQEAVPTISSLDIREETETELDQFSMTEIDLLSPLIIKAESAGEGVVKDLPLRQSKTPPPLPPRPQRIPSSSSICSTNSESAIDFHHTQNKFTEERSAKVKRVENWKRRLAMAREKLLTANSGVEIWTWRVGSDVDKICEDLLMRRVESKYKGVKDIAQETRAL